MPNPSDSQNNTQELVQKILFPLAYDGITAGEVQKAHARFVALIAQREQAAELRGRIDEWEKFIEYETGENGRLATLQATKPEKEGLPDGAVHVKPHKVQIMEPTIPDTDDDIEIEEG